jgi:tetratricopeptide (TPR) repeat protein
MKMLNELEPRRFHCLACLIIVLAGLIVYSNTLHSSFHYDDYHVIVYNPAIRDLSNISQFFQRNAFSPPSRGVVTTTLAINYYFSGISVEGYRWVNIFIHLLNGILAYSFVVITFGKCISVNDRTGLIRGVSSAHLLALFVALMFITAPSQTHSITYIVKRYGPISACFSLLSLILFIKAVEGTSIRRYMYAGSVLAFLFAIWSKETAYTMPAILFLYYQCFIAGEWGKPGTGLRLVSPYVVLAAVSFYLIMPVGELATVIVHPRGSYLLTQFNVIMAYIKLLLLPLPNRLSVDCDQRLVETIWEPRTLVSAVSIAAILATAFLYLSRARLLAFSILWFFVILVPTSSIIPLSETMVYYRLYMPGLGFYILLVVGIHEVFCRLHERKGNNFKLLRGVELAVLICIVVFYGVCAHEHNKVWSTEITLWEDTIQKSPHKIRPHYNLGKAYKQAGLKTKAREQYMICKELYIKSPNTIDAMGLRDCSMACNNLAVIYFEGGGLYNVAISMFKEAISINPKNACAHSNLGLAYYRIGKMNEAEAEQKLAIRMNSNYMLAYARLGSIYRKKGMLEEAIEQYREAIRLYPDSANAHGGLGKTYYKKGEYNKAIEQCREVIRIKPDSADAHYLLGVMYGKKGLHDLAIREYEEDVRQEGPARPCDKRV